MNVAVKLLSLLQVFISFTCNVFAAYDDSLNVQEIARIPDDSIGGLYDVWGWFDATNSEYYALLCNHSESGGLILVETTDPFSPNVIGVLFDAGLRHAADVKVAGDYLFVASEIEDANNPSEIWIFDIPEAIENPSSGPEKVLTLFDGISHGDTIPLNNCHNLFATDEYLFLAEYGSEEGYTDYEVAVLDISNPASPSLLTIWDQTDFDSTFIYPHDIHVRDTTAFVFCFGEEPGWFYGGGIFKVEFSRSTAEVQSWKKIWYDSFRGDVRNLDPWGTFDCGEQGTIAKTPSTHSGWLTDDGQYLVVADETGYLGLCPDVRAEIAQCLRIFDVDDFYLPGSPDTVAPVNAFDIIWDETAGEDLYIIGASAIDNQAPSETPCPGEDCVGGSPPPSFTSLGVHNPHVKGNLLFNAWYARGLQILDITDINNIQHAGYYDHETGSSGNWYQEAFGVYPYSPDGYIYVSGSQGFYLYRYGYTGVLDTNATWAGDIYIYDTLTVADTVRLVIDSGTKLYMFENALFKIEGTVVANGTSSDSVKFIALGGDPQPGDWQGIYVEQNAACTLKYVSITNAQNGLEMRDSSSVLLVHSNISDNSLSGIHNYKGILSFDTCRVDNNDYYGLYSYKAESVVDSCHFRANENYGIYCWLAQAGLDSTIINRCVIDNNGNAVIPDGSQYGILTNLDAMRISKCVIREYCQGAIKLTGSDAEVANCHLRRHGTYGIYAENNSDAYVRNCNFDSLAVGVKAIGGSLPDLGIVTADTGYSDLEHCSSYFVYHSSFSMSDTLKAEGNYFGSGIPSAQKFYGIVDYVPWLSDDPFGKISMEIQEPYSFRLDPSYPNPFNPTTTISFALDRSGHTVIIIYNLLGQHVYTLVNEFLDAGEHSLIWHGENDSGQPVSSGVYFYTLQSGDRFDSKKMLLLR